MIQQKLFYDISLFEAPITIYFFVDANTYRNQEFVYCWSDDLHFILKTFQLRRICNGPCISLFFLSTQSSTFLERAGIFSRWTDTDVFFWLRFAKYNDVLTCANYFLYFAMIGQIVMVRMFLNVIPKNVVESEQSNDRQESLNCHCEGLLICFLKEISQK